MPVQHRALADQVEKHQATKHRTSQENLLEMGGPERQNCITIANGGVCHHVEPGTLLHSPVAALNMTLQLDFPLNMTNAYHSPKEATTILFPRI